MNFKVVTYISLFTFLSVVGFGQSVKKTDRILYEILNSPNDDVLQTEWVGMCSGGMIYAPMINKGKLDSLQRILDNLNTTTKDKEYIYFMKVYTDCTYDVVKKYRFHFNYNEGTNTISGEEYRRLPKD